MFERISNKQLDELNQMLGDRDKKILTSIRDFRYLTSDQIKRLHFTDAINSSVALRAANRNLKKLKEIKLINAFDRRIGGIRSGSGAAVWRLESAGERLLRSLTNDARPRNQKHFQASRYFLVHTLSVAECYVRLTEICNGKDLKLVKVESEPKCWRQYNSAGKLVSLQPDLFAVTKCGKYIDHWFIEVDLDSESSGKIVEKCARYYRYYLSDLEQKQHKMFPLVVWIVPDSRRKANIRSYIKAEFSKLPNIFVVITMDEFDTLIRQGTVLDDEVGDG